MVGADVEENPRGTRVSPFFFSFFLACISLFFFVLHSSFFNATDLKTKSSNHLPSILPLFGSPSVQSTRSSLRSSSLLQSSKHLFRSVLPLFFFRSFLFCSSSKSSLRDLIFLFRTQVYKTRDLYGIILTTHQVGIESLNLEF